MGIRLAIAMIGLSILCLFSAPIYEATTWKGTVPAAVREQSSMIALGRATTDTLSGSVWYHAVRVAANQRLRTDVTSTDFDPVVALYTTSPDSIHQLAQDDDGGDGNNARLEYCIETAGTYLLRVTLFGSNRGGSVYQIHPVTEDADCAALRQAERDREAEEARQREIAAQRSAEEARTMYRQGRSVTIGQTVEGNLGSSSARTMDGKPFESWELSCGTGESFQMDVEGRGYDAYARIVDSNGNEMASNDDGGGSLNARINFTCGSSGPYYLVSTTYLSSGSGGSYVMRLSRR